MKKLQIITLYFFFTGFASATGQSFNYVVMNGDTLITYSNILGQYPNIQELYEKIYKEIEYEDRIINPHTYLYDEIECIEEHLIWTIQNEKVMLTQIASGSDKLVYADLKKIFGDKAAEGIVFADWLTDEIILCNGEVLVTGGCPICDNEIELIVKDGYVTACTAYKNYIAKTSNFTVDESFVYNSIDWERLPHFKNKSIQAFIEIRPNADGLFESFDEGSFVLIDYKIVTDPDNVFLKEAFRIARLVPDWDVIYRKNEILSQQLVIIFDKRMKKHVHK